MNWKAFVPGIALIVCAEFAVLCGLSGCVTSQSTDRQIERQIKFVSAAQKVYEATLDALIEAGEVMEDGKQDLKALLQKQEAEKVQELIDAEAPAAE